MRENLKNHIAIRKARISEYLNEIRMPSDAVAIMERMADDLCVDAKLKSLFERFFFDYIHNGYWTRAGFEPLFDPYVIQCYPEHTGLFYLLAALEKLPELKNYYSRMNIPSSVYIDTLSDVGFYVQKEFEESGTYNFRLFKWIWRHVEGRLFKVGRLQYIAEYYDWGYTVFRSIDGAIKVLCPDKLAVRNDGRLQCVSGQPFDDSGFTTSFESTSEGYYGFPVDIECGGVINERIFLPIDEWDILLRNGDMLLEVHIPKDGIFDESSVKGSFVKAEKFYADFFDEHRFKGFMCHTWMFTPQLKDLLPTKSNILRFQQQFMLLPHNGSKDFLWSFVFGSKATLENAPQETRLQQAALAHIKSGGDIYDLKGILLYDNTVSGRQA